MKEKERITYVIKEPLTENKEVNKATAQKDKDNKNNNQDVSKKKEKKEEPADQKEAKVTREYKLLMYLLLCQVYSYCFSFKSNKRMGLIIS